MTSFFEPDNLDLKNASVLYGKVREEYGGWEAYIYLDLLFEVNPDGGRR